MAVPNAEERIAIQKFRVRVGDILKPDQLQNDWFLIRWLRARELNLDKAEQMLRTSMKWREENKIDSTLMRPVDPYFSTNYPFEVTGKDREGRPLLVLPLGRWDARMAIDDGKAEQLTAYFNLFFESVMKAIRESGKDREGNPQTQFTAIVNWDGYSFKQFTNVKAAQTILKMSSVYEQHYPEILAQAIFINCTSVFQMLWSLMRKILAERTVGKIQVFGTNRKDWEPVILKAVDPMELRTELREGMQVSDEELQQLREAKGITDEDISALLVS